MLCTETNLTSIVCCVVYKTNVYERPGNKIILLQRNDMSLKSIIKENAKLDLRLVIHLWSMKRSYSSKRGLILRLAIESKV